jgi:AcrR family transcriptional regulator
VHTEATAAALLEAAEGIADADGLDGLTVRKVADAANTTTRAVYATLGSKEAMFAGLGARAFDLLGALVAALPRSADAAADLVSAGINGFRRWTLDHPALFRIAFLHEVSIPQEVWSTTGPSRLRALNALHELMLRLDGIGGLGGRTPEEAAWQFDALCEGLALMELRGGPLRPAEDWATTWNDALAALVAGWRATSQGLETGTCLQW